LTREARWLPVDVVEAVRTPAFVIDLDRLRRNLKRVEAVRQAASCKVLLSLKAFATWKVFGHMRNSLDGVSASSANEARLGATEMGKEVHYYAPAISAADAPTVFRHATHVAFNSLAQLDAFAPAARRRRVSCGIRLKPETKTGVPAVYDACAPHSRFGISRTQVGSASRRGIEGVLFHGLCGQGASELAALVSAVREQFGPLLACAKWINCGGGHLLTSEGYDLALLTSTLRHLGRQYEAEVILEPGEGIVSNAGFLVMSVLDVVDNGVKTAIVDASAANHVPTRMENPQPLQIQHSAPPQIFPHRYYLGGITCLSSDHFGEYSFPRPLRAGDRIVAADLAHYTMVRTSVFNGIRRPSIFSWCRREGLRLIRQFGFDDYRSSF
jgi:carboxynorspermidine decarboxylase